MHITPNPNAMADEPAYPSNKNFSKNVYSDTYFYNINCQPAEYGHSQARTTSIDGKPPIPPNPPSPMGYSNTLRKSQRHSQRSQVCALTL